MARKGRSPNYPAIGLGDAIDRAKKLYDKEGKAKTSPAVAVTAWGYAGLNGASMRVLSAVKQYGLIEEVGKDIRISELAITILHGSEADKEQARKKAAYTPKIFADVFEEYNDGLPSDDTLRSYLITKKHFNPNAAKIFIGAFNETIDVAKLKDNGYIASKEKHEKAEKEGEYGQEGIPPRPEGGGKMEGASQALHVFSWPLSKGIKAEVRFSGGAINASHLELLRKYLELAKGAVGSDDPAEKKEG